jgi:soluble lytic murein transglycosylase-like protein
MTKDVTRAQVWLRATLVGGVALAVVVGAGPGAAQAETAADARAKADAAAAQVDRLKPRVDAALAAYQAALVGLSHDVTTGIRANQAADAATLAKTDAVRAADQRVRALYMSGGQTSLLASVLDAQSPSDLARRIGILGRVVDADQRTADAARVSATDAVTVAKVQESVADTTTATVGGVEDRLRALTDLLDQAQAALDALDAQASSLEAAERAAAELAAARAAADSARWAAAGTATARGIPLSFLALYRSGAATCPGLPWPVLAAIGQVESGHGSNPDDSSAGAQGPMQFLPSTFAAYAVDGDGDGAADIRNPADAIYTAAHYLCANKAGTGDDGLRGAVYRYNHADWYVAMVLRIAAQIAEKFGEPPVAPYVPVGG